MLGTVEMSSRILSTYYTSGTILSSVHTLFSSNPHNYSVREVCITVHILLMRTLRQRKFAYLVQSHAVRKGRRFLK